MTARRGPMGRSVDGISEKSLTSLVLPARGVYLHGMSRALVRRVVYALAAMQLLLAAPVASSMAQSAALDTAHASALHDAVPGSMPEPCHCCLEGAADLAACISSCGTAAALLPVLLTGLARSAPVPARAFSPTSHCLPADPPLKPPPIA